jgi:hypothetical protein
MKTSNLLYAFATFVVVSAAAVNIRDDSPQDTGPLATIKVYFQCYGGEDCQRGNSTPILTQYKDGAKSESTSLDYASGFASRVENDYWRPFGEVTLLNLPEEGPKPIDFRVDGNHFYKVDKEYHSVVSVQSREMIKRLWLCVVYCYARQQPHLERI